MKNSSNLSLFLANPTTRVKVERELATRSLREFVRQAWHVVEPATIFVPGFHIDAIIEHLEAVSRGEIMRLLINVPPRHMKSLLVSVFWPATCTCPIRIMLPGSTTSSKSACSSRTARTTIR